MQWATGRPYNLTEGITDVFGYGSGVARDARRRAQQRSDQPHGDQELYGDAAAGVPGSRHLPPVALQLPARRGFLPARRAFGRNFKFGEKAKLEVFFQAFDLTNRANFGISYNANIRSAAFQTPTGFISGNGVVLPKSFAGEFGAKFSF